MKQLQGMRVFITVWLGQLLSLVGSGLTSFALGLWVVERCHAATPFALIAMFTVLPAVALAPLAGILADRHDRRQIMLVADTAAGLATLVIAGLLVTDQLQVWQVYITAAASGAAAAFQQPAYLAATSQLVPERQLGRAAGMVQMAQAAADVLAPFMAGLLMVVIGVLGVVMIDLATFLIAVVTLVLVRFPGLPTGRGDDSRQVGNGAAWSQQMAAGWHYIGRRPGLIALLGFLAVASFSSGMVGALLVPMLVTIASAATAGVVISVAGSGMMIGSVVMSLWGGPRRRVRGVLGFELMKGLGIVLMGLWPSTWLVAIGAAWAHFCIPFARASNQAIWQATVPHELQGRVFAVRHMITRIAMPLAFLVAGPLADNLFEPLMADGAALAAHVGAYLGSGPGRGTAVIFVLMGSLIVVASAVSALSTRVRSVG
jgi:hypothetical protein